MSYVIRKKNVGNEVFKNRWSYISTDQSEYQVNTHRHKELTLTSSSVL